MSSEELQSSARPISTGNEVLTGDYARSNEKTNDSERQPTPTQQIPTDKDDTDEYVTGIRLFAITVSLCLAVFLMALDQSIVSTAIPKITDTFASLNDIGWYGSAYLLTTAALQLLFGKFYTFLNLKWMFLIAIGIFELGSLICGVAQNSVTLIVGRAVAGVGGAGMFTGGLLVLAKSLPLAKRPLYTGIITSMYGIASVAGPLLGGVFTDRATWRWCFFINLPIGAITIIGISIFFRSPKQTIMTFPKEEPLMVRINRFDPIGNSIFIPAIVCLLLAMQWGGTTYAWDNGRIIALLVVFGVLFLAFVGLQVWENQNATVPPHIIKRRSIWSSGLYSFCIGASQFVMVYYVPVWFQAIQGVSAFESGIRILPLLLSEVVMSLISGAVVTAFGYYAPLMFLGTILLSIGSGLISTWTPDTGSPVWIGYQVLFGAGFGVALQQPMLAAQTVLENADIGVGMALMTFLQSLGGALFVSVGQNVFDNQLVTEIAKYAPSVDPELVVAAGTTSFRNVVPADQLTNVILSYNNALAKTFLISAGTSAATFLGAAAVEWKSVKGKKVETGVA